MALLKELLEILVCPQCKGDLYLLPDNAGLICRACRLKYPIHDEIPIMLVEEAESIGE
ncbi:MAG TPA: Trm112 family protein [Geobacteraceae bacterium]|nr:Trm112 family protein [Geobacteraceae bacterium]